MYFHCRCSFLYTFVAASTIESTGSCTPSWSWRWWVHDSSVWPIRWHDIRSHSPTHGLDIFGVYHLMSYFIFCCFGFFSLVSYLSKNNCTEHLKMICRFFWMLLQCNGWRKCGSCGCHIGNSMIYSSCTVPLIQDVSHLCKKGIATNCHSVCRFNY